VSLNAAPLVARLESQPSGGTKMILDTPVTLKLGDQLVGLS
jgi:hypothetical protein